MPAFREGAAVESYMFIDHNNLERSGRIVQIIGRAQRDPMVKYPAFRIRFSDGYETTAHSPNLHPWYRVKR